MRDASKIGQRAKFGVFMHESEWPESLTDDQRLELAACYAELCGADPDYRDDWRSEMVKAKRQVSELMAIWDKRAKKAKAANHELG